MLATIESNGTASLAQTDGPHILSAVKLHKTYNGAPALRELSFSLEAGRVLGFLGPNGAGKTTAIRILTTILEPSSGEFYVAGISSAYPDKIRYKIGVLPESLGFPKQMTAIEYLTYFGQHYGRKAATAKANAMTLLEEVRLLHKANAPIGTYSRGMRQRLGIARALVNDPLVVFLDEPTLGLDPRGKQELLDMVQRIAHQRGAGVILCSHLLTEVEEVCDDVIIMRLGHVVASGTVAEVLDRARRGSTRIRVPSLMVTEAMRLVAELPTVAAVTPASGRPDWLDIHLHDRSTDEQYNMNSILNALIRADIPVLSFDAEGGRLQDVFFQLTEESNA